MTTLTAEANYFQNTVVKIEQQISKHSLWVISQNIMSTVGYKGGWTINEANTLIRLIEKRISEL